MWPKVLLLLGVVFSACVSGYCANKRFPAALLKNSRLLGSSSGSGSAGVRAHVDVNRDARWMRSALHMCDASDADAQVVGMPSKAGFGSYFSSAVAAGSEMNLEQMLQYSEVSTVLNAGSVVLEDVNDLWISAVGDASGLDREEAYELLCMIQDLRDPENEEFYDKEFAKLADGGASLMFFKFLGWQDVQDMMTDGIVTMEEVSEIWRGAAGDLNSPVDRAVFGKLNTALDDMVEEKEDGDSAGVKAAPSAKDAVFVTDVWAKGFDPKSAFDADALKELSDFFSSPVGAGSSAGQLSFSQFCAWDDVREILGEQAISEPALKAAWAEAADGESPDATVTFDRFLRLNVKMDLLMDEPPALSATASNTASSGGSSAGAAVSDTIASSSGGNKDSEDGEDPEEFYRKEFKKLSGDNRLIRLDMLMEWEEIRGLLADKVVTEKQVSRMFEGMPKEPMGLGGGAESTFGIGEDTFVAFNGMLDVVLDASGASGASGEATTPNVLVSEPERPMPAQAELKMGEIGMGLVEGEDDNIDSGLSDEQLQLMEVLDKADNMLNSGSFGDFDTLIGDVDDPRLAALRERSADMQQIQGELNEVIDELLELTQKQSRCGLDRPEEEEAARIRDLIQGIIEKAPKAASRDLEALRKDVNGKWRLLYSNSEMFSFYNGVTGFANVFPTTKFQDLSVQYLSDGFVSESRYFEKLSSPLGEIDATVFSNWEVVKEMSFMTNDNSVVLRNYCQKVTAGPMEYLAEENWKSLRTMSMNELIYVDDRIKVMRNTGALRIFFVYLREK